MGVLGGSPLTSCIWTAKCYACEDSCTAAALPGDLPIKKSSCIAATGRGPVNDPFFYLQKVIEIFPARGEVFNDFAALQGCANGVGGLHAGAVPVETQDDFSGAGMVLQIRLQGRGQLRRFAVSGALDAADGQAGGLSPIAAPELQQRQIKVSDCTIVR